MKDAAGYLLVALAGALLCYIFLPADPVVYTEVVVPAARILEREPPARPPTIVERIRYVQIQPRQVATAPGGGAAQVLEFCAPTVASVNNEQIDTSPVLLLRSGSHSPGWFWRRDGLFLSGVTSHGDLKAFDFEVRPGFDFRTSGDSVLVRYPRTGLLREVVEIALPMALGWGLARVW